MRHSLPVLLLLMAPALRADIIMTPYLQTPAATSMQVAAECNSADRMTVEYGPTTSYGNSAATSTYKTTSTGTFVHNVQITGLSPNRLYHYRVKQGASTSSDATFRTPPLPGTPFRFAWIADNRGAPSIYDRVLKLVQAADPLLILHGGDIASDGSYANIKSEFFTSTALSVYSHVPFVLTIGNHEQWSENPMAFDEPPIPSPSGTPDYYSLDCGDMHVLVLLLYTGDNTYYDTSPGSPQYNFARSDLQGSARSWKVVISHKVPYTNSSDAHTESEELFPIDQKVFVPNKVDVWFGGHNHFYQHSTRSGIHYETIGSCGAELYTPLAGPSATYLNMLSTYCYGIVDVTPTAFHLAVYDDHGAALDKLDLTKPLPVQISSFSSTPTATGARLVWTTLSETNNYGFEVQSSGDLHSWKNLGLVRGSGTTLAPQTYSFPAPPAAYYRLEQIDLDGTVHYSEVITGHSATGFALEQNYPNPFNPVTTIRYSLEKTGYARLTVTNMIGQVVFSTPDEVQEAGPHAIAFDGSQFPSGTYVYTLKTDGHRASKTMLLLR